MAFSKKAVAVLLMAMAVAQPFAALGQIAAANSDGADNGNTAAQRNANTNNNGNAGNNNGNRNGGNNNGNGNGGNNNGRGNSKGDPLIQAFDGSLFFFHGEPGKIYNLASIAGGFQVNALLKEANNAVHIGSNKNGTYMQAIGFRQGNVKVSAETYADDSSRMVVKVNGETLDLSEASVARTVGNVSITFKNFEANMGTVLTIRSPHVSIAVSLVPPGLDHAGYWQPSYVNVELTLLTAPTATLQGVIGDTFQFEGRTKSASSVDANDKVPVIAAYTDLIYPVFPDMTYEVPTLFAQQKMTFTADFIHGVIMMRKAAAAKLAGAFSVA